MNNEEILKKWQPILDNMGITGSRSECLLENTEDTYDFPSLLPIAKKIAAKTIGQAASDILLNPTGGNTFGDAVIGMAGMAVNPQIFVLFRGIDLRRFQFDFIFTPKSPQEAKNVRNIIKAFRFHAAPEIRSDFSRYYVAPSTFNIEFMYKDKINQNIFQMTTCVLNRLSVDYAPYGWATFNDGMPVQTILSMSFQETEIITKSKVNEGY